ncbi:unnamed protein product [Enterobius vermicularis]|uniref:Ovule protein n=1 Tax=Enterobius vermicularis TaxID=51028 RepID=A0A0N4V1C4_ENTVE|nr:unnamed protein product [Enterobius vermicularis]
MNFMISLPYQQKLSTKTPIRNTTSREFGPYRMVQSLLHIYVSLYVFVISNSFLLFRY